VALIGQPNCGKSTIFNWVAGYHSEVSNFPGVTVKAARSSVRLNGWTLELVDLPGVYSLTACNPAETAANAFLLHAGVDLVINVLDASLLSRSLELTLELRELGIPMVVCLNMSDEARRKGIRISREELEAALQVPVVETIASKGEGIQELFARTKTELARTRAALPPLTWSRDVEQELAELEARLPADSDGLLPRFVAIKLLEGDECIAAKFAAGIRAAAEEQRTRLGEKRGRTPAMVIMSERHDLAMRICEQAAEVGRPASDFRDRIDSVLTHPLWGYVALIAALVGFFWGVFGLGSLIEKLLQAHLADIYAYLFSQLAPGTLAEAVVHSIWDGFVGGAVIVLPYLVPFLFGLAILEDVGYLPRVAYLMDGLLHRIGLHGTSTLPLILGYGCSVPACLATRILPSRRDRFLTNVLATLVPCSARSNVIFALAGFYLGPAWALGIFGLNAVVVVLTGAFMSRLWPEVSPGMILEVPRYQLPQPVMVVRKVWLRIREFVMLSWPLLIAGSLVLGLAEHWKWDHLIDTGLSPITHVLGLPLAVGTTLVFGVLRKELSMVMLVQALGTSDIHHVMTAAQIVVFTIFVTFYIPCVATIAALVREVGKRLTAVAIAYTFTLALILGLAARMLMSLVPR
jgi:ferrous iron transport protein B